MIGKWHLSDDPTGFDYWCVLPGQGVYFDPEFIENGERAKKFPGYCTDITTDLALNFLKTAATRSRCCWSISTRRRTVPSSPRRGTPNVFDDIELPYPATFNDNYATRKHGQGSRRHALRHQPGATTTKMSSQKSLRRRAQEVDLPAIREGLLSRRLRSGREPGAGS